MNAGAKFIFPTRRRLLFVHIPRFIHWGKQFLSASVFKSFLFTGLKKKEEKRKRASRQVLTFFENAKGATSK